MKNVCGIYKIVNPLGKIYIGASKNIIQRYFKYKTLNFKYQRLMLESIELYGWDNHIMTVIEECLEEDLLCRERHWQLHFDVLNGGLNCIIEACGDNKRIYSEETSLLLSKMKSGEKHPFYGKRGSQTPMYGRKHSDEAKQKMRESSIGKICSEETRKILSLKNSGELNGFYGKSHTEQTKQKMSLNHADFSKGNHPQAKLVLNLETGIFYDCVEEASETINVKRATLSSWLSSARPNKSNFIYC